MNKNQKVAFERRRKKQYKTKKKYQCKTKFLNARFLLISVCVQIGARIYMHSSLILSISSKYPVANEKKNIHAITHFARKCLVNFFLTSLQTLLCFWSPSNLIEQQTGNYRFDAKLNICKFECLNLKEKKAKVWPNVRMNTEKYALVACDKKNHS